MTVYDPEADLLQEREDRFDESVDEATQKVIDTFDWMTLPEGEELSQLMVTLNDTITQIFNGYKPDVGAKV